MSVKPVLDLLGHRKHDTCSAVVESSVYEEIGAVEQPSHIYRVVESPETTYEKKGVVGQPNHTYAVVESQETKYEKIGAVGQPNNVYDHLS